ncbi:MAG: gamma carbonic anhydrase family protein [Lachnospiraceae bacterium]|nr:gamma carbonic anhydrase family protein [Lachnospiraceae bacterium]
MKNPQIHADAFLAPDADVYGDVTIGKDCSIWFHAVVRGERAPIVIGEGSNVQDNCVVHVDAGHNVEIGEYVTIGHGAIVHGCKIGDNTLVGMGAIILNGAVIGKNCVIGAGALVTQNAVVPDNSLVIGSPAKVLRAVKPEEAAASRTNAQHYIEEGKSYAAYFAGK